MHPALEQQAGVDRAFKAQLNTLTDFSPYAEKVLEENAEWWVEQWRSGVVQMTQQALGLDTRLTADMASYQMPGEPRCDLPSLPETHQMAALRQTRHRFLLLIMWRDFAGADNVSETLAALSSLAETLISSAVAMAEMALTERFGIPRDGDGQRQSLVVLGMGKLGGRELNFSSDVDLIFSFAKAGKTDGSRGLSNEEYFARVIRQAVRLLDTVTDQGFVYRVDLRLRPFGDAGRLALSFGAMEQYYLREGRDWERYALQKARPIAGDLQQGQLLLKSLRPFVYRRYLDFGAFEALRQMKALIRENGREKERNIKLGIGGIREIEFLTQAFQLVRGGRQADLQQVSLLPALQALGQHHLLPEREVDDLSQAYRFLRRVENRLQQKADQQTHQLPVGAEDSEALAQVCGFPNADAFFLTLSRWRDTVHEIFRETFAPTRSASQDQWEWQVWNLAADDKRSQAALTELNYASAEEAAAALQRFRRRSALRDAGVKGRALIDQLLPQVIKEIASAGGATQLLRDVLEIIASIARRTAYLALLTERPSVTERLIWVCGHSRWLTQRILDQPGLLDDLIAPTPSLDPQQLHRQLQLARSAAENDPEQELMSMCQCQQREMVGLAIAFLNGNLDALKVGALLTNLAQGLLAHVIEVATNSLVSRHGGPGQATLAAIGYGTLGTAEMRFDSDLDLVFLTQGVVDDAQTNGAKPLRVQQFFTRLVQRVLSMLTLRTPFGSLYEVDTRLRPNGNAGFLVSSLKAYGTYQNNNAWVWELQALVRARWVGGDNSLSDAFKQIRGQVLDTQRSVVEMRTEICAMRSKMQRETQGAADRFKFRPGARLDIEFLAQFLCLANAHDHPSLISAAGTPELIEAAAECGLLSSQQRQVLVDGYASSADSELRISLGSQLSATAGAEEAAVIKVWQDFMES